MAKKPKKNKKPKKTTTGVNGASSSSSTSLSSNNTLRVIMYAGLIACVARLLYSNMSMPNSVSQLLMMKTITDTATATATATAVSVAIAADTTVYNSNMSQEYVPSRTEKYSVNNSIIIPRRFDDASIHMTKVLATLGPNILTVYSGCRMARWVYPFRKHSNVVYNNWKHDDCNAINPDKMIRNISQLSENDTIYVLHTRLRHFVEQLKLEELLVDIVVVSGQWAKVTPNEQEDIDYVVAHPRVISWFIQNLDLYGGNNYSNATRLKRPPKVNPFPYGIQERPYMGQKPKQLFMEQYKDAFMMALNRDAEDGNMSATAVPRIYAGHIRSLESRKEMETSKKLGRPQFYAVLSQHDYVLSPDGDRPECYRHYEALGLGTVPLTQLDLHVHRHFIGTGLIFNNTVWSVQELETKLLMNPTVNRNAALEEYWMEYVDWVVQRHLTWYDTSKQEPTTIIRILANLTF